MTPTLGTIFLSEFVGTALLVLLGCGVTANTVLKHSKGYRGGWLQIAVGWGFAVYVGVLVGYASGPHINPAITLAFLLLGEVTPLAALVYVSAQLVGAILGALLVWVVYFRQLGAEDIQIEQLAVFATVPANRSFVNSFAAETIATFVFVFGVLSFGHNGDASGVGALGALPAALLVMTVVACLGGQSATAINPARDLGPRIVHALVPIRGKGGSDWAYSWIPILGPLTGGAFAALASLAVFA